MTAVGRYCCKSRSAPCRTLGVPLRMESWFWSASFEESNSSQRHRKKWHFGCSLSICASEVQLGLLQHNRHRADRQRYRTTPSAAAGTTGALGPRWRREVLTRLRRSCLSAPDVAKASLSYVLRFFLGIRFAMSYGRPNARSSDKRVNPPPPRR